MAPTTPPFIVVPLYMYPLKGAWDPLFEAARFRPEVTFIAVVNPNSGPGTDVLPDASYLAALQEMGAIANILALGYVHCSYGRRALGTVTRDIDVYRRWNMEADPAIRIDGIFFDEAPSDSAHIQYMRQATEHVHASWRSELTRSGQAMLNPGVVVSRDYFDHADHVVVFEQSEEHWERYFVTQGLPQIASTARPKAVAIVHTCGTAKDELTKLVREIKLMGFGGLYITEQVGGGYSKWPKLLEHILDVVAEP